MQKTVKGIEHVKGVNMDARADMGMRVGDTVRVHQKVKESDGKTRIQLFEGLVITRKHNNEAGGTFTVRKVSNGVGVEKTYPLYTPMIDKIEIIRRSTVRRAKLYNVRVKATREIRRTLRKMRVMNITDASPVVEAPTETVAAEEKSE